MKKHRQLIEKSLKGDAVAFEKIYQLHARRLMGVCLRYATNRDEAQDLLQEAFIKIYEKLSTFTKDGSFEGWMHRITVNVALDKFRKTQRNIVSSTSDYSLVNDDGMQAEDILSKIAHNDLLKLVQELTPAYRTIFNLYAIEGYKHNEIAEILNISEGTSKSNLSDARKILQKKIKQLMYEATDKPQYDN